MLRRPRKRESRSSGFGGEGEVEGLRLTTVIDFDFVGLGAQSYMPGGDGLAAGRKLRQDETAVVARNSKVRRP